MNAYESWFLNIKGNALQQLDKIAGSSRRANTAFSDTQRNAGLLGQNINRSGGSIDNLNRRLEYLQQRQRAAFDTRHIANYNQMIAKTRAEIDKLENLGMKKSLGSGGFFSAKNMLKAGAFGLAGAGVAGLGMLAGGVVPTIRGFDKEMSAAYAISGATGSDRELLKQTAIDVGGRTTFTATDAAKGLTYLLQSGFNAQQASAALPVATNMAMAGDMDLAQSADILANTVSQFRYMASESNIVANVMAATATSSNTNIMQAAEAFKYLGPTAASLNMSLEQTAATIGILANNGIKGSMAGRALGTSLVNLAKPTKQQQEMMDKIGFSAYDASGRFVGLDGVLQQLERSTENKTDQEKAAILQTIFGAEAYQEVTSLLKTGSAAFTEYQASITGTNKSLEMAKIRTDNLDGDLEQLGGAWETFTLTILNGNGRIANSLRAATQALTQFISNTTAEEKYGIKDNKAAFMSGNFLDLATGRTGEQRSNALSLISTMDEKLNEISAGGMNNNQKRAALLDLYSFNNNPAAQLGLEEGAFDDKALLNIQRDYRKKITDMMSSLNGGVPTATNSKDTNSTESNGQTSGSDLVNAIAGGGKQSVSYVVNLRSFNEGGINMNVSQGGVAQSLPDVERQFMEMFMRILNNGGRVING